MLTLAVFWPATRNAFVNYDDPDYVYNNAHVTEGLSPANVGWAFTTGHAGNYHPFTWISLMADRSIFGFEPGAFHRTNVILHAINAALLLIVLRGASGMTWRSGIAAAIFALHPLRVESVAWATERKDVLSMFFMLVTLGMYVWYAHGPRLGRYLLVAVLFECALLSKSTAVTLPAIFLLLDFWPLRRVKLDDEAAGSLKRPLRALIIEKIPLFAMSLVACALTIKMQAGTSSIGSVDKYPITARLANALAAYMRYIRKWFVPVDLAVFYPNHQNVTAWMVAISVVTLAAITALALRRRTRWPWLTVGWLWFCGAMVPMIGLVQSGAQSMADRFTYLPMIGLAIVAAWAVPQKWFEEARGRWAIGAATCALLIAMSLATREQISYWQNSQTLFEHALAVTNDNHVAHNNLAFELQQQKQYGEARAHYLAALKIHPTYSIAHNGLGSILAKQGDTFGAAQEYALAVKYNPNYLVGRRNLGVQLANAGNVEAAIEQYQKCLAISPHDAATHSLLGMTLAQSGRLEEAAAYFKAATLADAGSAQAFVNLGHVLLEMKKYEPAIAALKQAIALDPKSGEAHFHAGSAFAQIKEYSAAARQFQLVLQLQPGDPAAQVALQDVMSRSGQRTASVAE